MKTYLTYSLMALCIVSYAQNVSVSGDAKLTFESGSGLKAFGLEMNPNADFVITNNTLSLSNTQELVSNMQPSILRVYSWASTLNNFSGAMTLDYEDSELNGGVESTLNIEVLDSGIWTKYEPSFVDTVNNKVIYNGTFNNISIDKITASAVGITLSTESTNFEPLRLYPNPAQNLLHVEANTALKYQLFNMEGKQVMETTKNTIDLTTLANGIYILKATQLETSGSRYYKIIKN